MLEYLIQLPSETLGHNVLGFLEMIDIIQLENAVASKKSQRLLKTILPYCPPILVESAKYFIFNRQAIIWCNKRRLRVQHAKMHVELLCDLSVQHNVFGSIELFIMENTQLQHLEPLKNPFIIREVTRVHIKGDQDPAVMEVLFSVLTYSSVYSLDIETDNIVNNDSSNLSQWIEHIKKIGPCLRELSIQDSHEDESIIKTITEYCPYLEKLSLSYGSGVSDRTILQTIANNCPHLRRLEIENLDYNTSAVCDADLTAFAEKCPQLEELSLNCRQLTDQSVIALAQHCSRLKKLALSRYKLTAASLIALSGRGLPLQELDIPSILIPSAEIAAQCAHALSRIQELNTEYYEEESEGLSYAIQYMTGLRELYLYSSEDHLLVPHLLLLLQGQCCAGLEILLIGSEYSSITPQQLCELVTACSQLHTVYINHSTCTSDTVLVELARSCPHLQKITLNSKAVTEEGVLTLAAHCRQLRAIDITVATDSEIITWKLEHCPRRITKTCSPVSVYDSDNYD